MRFLTPTPRLSDRELDYLTHLDYKRHFAWGVACKSHGIAVGRYVCDAADATMAEVALTVIDAMQVRPQSRNACGTRVILTGMSL